MTWKFNVGQMVRYAVASGGQHWQGRIMSREWYEDDSGTGEWYHVRWIEPSGRPSDRSEKLHPNELEATG